ncbi:sigma factor [uncultured Modestobacter sp.]|uniref:sigma factor n=1 Tax=uncultured Modestobacter sp. TaxID=380048 RepID=UPI00263721A2|nr:sigma factor [uncultured Modestobacter sp.]
MDQRGTAFPAFVAEHEPQLRGTALLLTADPVDAEDLLVAALAGVHRRWRRLDSPAAALAHARDSLVAGALGGAGLPAGGLVTDQQQPDDDDRWLQALAELDPRTRAATVLRLHEGQDEDATAALLGCSPAEVGAALADALDVLAPLLSEGPSRGLLHHPEPAAQAAHENGHSPGPETAGPLPTPVAHATSAHPDAAYRRPGAPTPRPQTPAAPTGDHDPHAAYRRPGTPAARPATPAAPAGDDDPHAAYRRPDARPSRPESPAVPVPDVGRDSDPDAIYRRPT